MSFELPKIDNNITEAVDGWVNINMDKRKKPRYEYIKPFFHEEIMLADGSIVEIEHDIRKTIEKLQDDKALNYGKIKILDKIIKHGNCNFLLCDKCPLYALDCSNEDMEKFIKLVKEEKERLLKCE